MGSTIVDRNRERLLTMQYATTRVIAEAATIDDGIAGILEAICQTLSWVHGGVWIVDSEARVLRCLHTWHAPEAQVAEFEALSRETTFTPGVGLPGRVWASGQPAWIPDVLKDSNFPRAAVAGREGLHGAFGFPILLGGEIQGVMEFFSREIREPDEELLRSLFTIGGQIGQFLVWCPRRNGPPGVFASYWSRTITSTRRWRSASSRSEGTRSPWPRTGSRR